MNTQERVLFVAKHTFLKYGYERATMQRIAKSSDTTPATIRYYYRSKQNLFKIVFYGYIEILIDYVKNWDPIEKDLDVEIRNIEYPEMHEIAWFLANEFHSNSKQVYKLLKENTALRKVFHKAHVNNEIKEKFETLIQLNVRMIILKNFLRITNPGDARDLSTLKNQ